MFRDIAGLLEMAVCCAKPPYALATDPNYSPADAFNDQLFLFSSGDLN